MKNGLMSVRELREAGASDDMVAQYQLYLDAGNRRGEEFVLCQLRKMQAEKIRSNREKLACLDYIIARVEQTHEF